MTNNIPSNNQTLVTGLWNINRNGRDFNTHYIEAFKRFLDTPLN